MIRQETVLDLVDRIYAAAEDSGRWMAFLERLGHVAHSPLTALVFEDARSRQASVAQAVGFDPSFAREYEQHYAARNAWIAASSKFRPGDVITSEQLLPDDVFLQTEYYNDFLQKMDKRYLLGTFPFRNQATFAHLSLLRPKRNGPFRNTESLLLQALVPHLQRALQLHRRIVELERCRDATGEALDRAPFGVALIDAKGIVLLTNRAADEIFSARDGLALRREGIVAEQSAQARELRVLLSAAMSASVRGHLDSGGILAISRPSMKRPYTVLISPLHSVSSIFGATGPAAALFITDPERRVETNHELLRRSFGLTPAEATFADRLIRGESVEEAAAFLEITINTARTHIRHLLEKTGSRRQGALVRILMLAAAGLRDTGGRMTSKA